MEEQAVESNDTLQSLVDAAEPTLGEGEFFLSEGIKGVGDLPEWYKADKYKSVAEQAKAYTELEKKFGGFTGTKGRIRTSRRCRSRRCVVGRAG